MTGPGRFILVVGPSGAGKDTLIAGARAQLADDDRFVFPARLVTRQSLPRAEAHVTISRADFDRMIATGDYALGWEALGLGYVVPKAVAEAVAEGKIAVCNASRRIVPDAMARYPATRVVFVDALRIIRATRLAARGRETPGEIERRLLREVPELADGVPVTRIDNSGAMAEGIAAFVAALCALAEGDEDEGMRR